MGFEKGKIFVISGPSGVGKSTIVKAVSEKTGLSVSISATTRPKGKSETNGKDYWFITKEEFQEKIKRELFLEYAEVFGNYYGTPKDKIEELVNSGKSVILEIDTQGGIIVKSLYPEAVMIFILPPTKSELKKRLSKRGRETDTDAETANRRLSSASDEIATAWQHYKYMVVNDILENAIDEIVNIIKKETGAKQ